MNYQNILSDQPIDTQSFPYNSIEFFDEEKLVEKYYVDKSKMKENASDQLEEVVDSYLEEHPDIRKAVAYREEGPDNRFAFREFGRN